MLAQHAQQSNPKRSTADFVSTRRLHSDAAERAPISHKRTLRADWLSDESFTRVEGGRKLRYTRTNLQPDDVRPQGAKIVAFGSVLWVETDVTVRRKKAALDPTSIWTRRFDGIASTKAKSALMGGLEAVGAQLLTIGLSAMGGAGGGDEPPAKRRALDPIAGLISTCETIRRLIGVPLPNAMVKVAPKDGARIRPGEEPWTMSEPVDSQQSAWMTIDKKGPGRASTVVNIFTRAPKDKLVQALDAAKAHLVQLGYKPQMADVIRAPRHIAFNAYMGTIRCLPPVKKPAS